MKNERGFKREFLDHARAMTGWPAEASVKIWCEGERIAFMKNGVYSRLASGAPLDDRYVRVVVKYLLDPRHVGYESRKALDAFLHQLGVADPRKLSAEEVVELVSDAGVGDDGFGIGPRAMAMIFGHVVKPSGRIRPIGSEDEVRAATGWMCAEAGRQLTSFDLPAFEAVTQAERKMGIKFGEYQERVVSWWRREPWTVVHIVDRDKPSAKPTGVAFALPVTDSFYERARSGECASHECLPQDIKYPSSNVIIEGVAAEPDVRRQGGSSLSLFIPTLCQQARISDVGSELGAAIELKLLSFHGTPVGKKRLKRFGFKPTGTFFPRTEIEYMERPFSYATNKFLDAIWMGVWKGLQEHLRRKYGRIQG